MAPSVIVFAPVMNTPFAVAFPALYCGVVIPPDHPVICPEVCTVVEVSGALENEPLAVEYAYVPF